MTSHRRTVVVVAVTSGVLIFAAVSVAATIRGTQDSDDPLDGTAGPDKIIANKGDDVVNGLGGDDRIGGGRGADTLNAGDGNDRVWAGSDADLVNGEVGDDALRGKRGSDSLDGGEGNDFLNGGQGVDDVDGGVGNDTVRSLGDGNRADSITCGEDGGGTDIDTVFADRRDNVSSDCEVVWQTNGPKPPNPHKP